MRGKHATIAERRRAVEAAESELMALRRKNVQLLEENRALKAEADRKQRAHAQEVRRLRAERDADAAPKVAVLQQKLAGERVALQRMTAAVAGAVAQRKRGAQRVLRHFRTEHGMTHLEASEMVMRLFLVENEDDPAVFEVVGNEDIAGLRRAHRLALADPDRGNSENEHLNALQRARGARRPE